MNIIPDGYTLYETSDDFIMLMVTDFSLIAEEAIEKVYYDGKCYIRDTIEVIPEELIGRACSMRKYIKEIK